MNEKVFRPAGPPCKSRRGTGASCVRVARAALFTLAVVAAGGGLLEAGLVGGRRVRGGPAEEAPGAVPFTAMTEQAGLGDVRAYGFGVAAADYDNDGDEDLLLTTLEENMLFQNEGGTFREVGREAGLAEDACWSTSALFFDPDRDGDRDGDLDVLFMENNGPAHLWRNDLAEAHFLRVHLRGTESNRDGIGARLRARVGGLTMERRVRAGGSYLSQLEKTATFGLETRRDVAVLEVRWPSRQVERFEQVAPDQSVVLVEGAGELVRRPPNQAFPPR